jgi:protein phosphatase
MYPIESGNGYLVAIADGVGGYKGGKEASSSVISSLSKLSISEGDIDSTFSFLKTIVNNLSRDDESLRAAATTLTFCHLSKNGITVGHTGDCRLYFRSGHKLVQITKDHTQHQMLIDEGYFTARQLKKAQGKNVITSALSSKIPLSYQSLYIPKDKLPLDKGTIVLYLMSDGAHSHWENRPRFSVSTLESPSKFASSLQKRIETKGPEDDYSLLSVKLLFPEF